MANVLMNDFLNIFYMQDRIMNMPEAQFAQYVDYLNANDGKGDFRGNMKKWRDYKLLDINGTEVTYHFVTKNDNNWERNLQYPGDPGTLHVTPSPIQMDDNDWKKLFKDLQKSFREMDSHRNDFRDNDKATDFLDEYFGQNKLFLHANASPEAENEITNVLKPYLNANGPKLEVQLKSWGIIDDDFTFNKLIDAIDTKKYNSNSKIQDKLKQLVQYINYYQSDLVDHGIPEQQFQHIENGFDNDSIATDKLDYFKRNYQNILSQASKDKVFNVFKNYSPTVSKAMEHAKNTVNYNDKNSEDYILPKRNDQLTDWQKISDMVGKSWHNHMDKYTKLRGGHVYFSPQAKSIVNALDGAKFKPNDGLEKLLENAEKIKQNLQYKSPTATAHFDWMVKKLGELKDKKMFKGALKNATQMKALVSELAIMALEDKKPESQEAVKTAMEVLTVIRYGYTTSNVLDAMKKENVSIFSDKNLSWNKHVKFITTAMDKSIKYAFLGAGYLLNGVGHFMKTRGKKFNAKNGKKNKYQKDMEQRTAAELSNLNQQQDADQTQRTSIQTKLDGYRRAGHDDVYWENEINSLQGIISQQDADLKYLNDWIQAPANAGSPDLSTVAQFYQDVKDKRPITHVSTVTDPTLQTYLNRIFGNLHNVESSRAALPNAVNKLREFRDGVDTINMLDAQISSRQDKIDNWDKNHQDEFATLMVHWDFLQSGSSRTGENIFQRIWNATPMRGQSAKQKRYDKEDATGKALKAKLYEDWMRKHGY